MITTMAFLLSLVSLPLTELSAEPYTVELVNEDGSKFDEALFGTLMLDTWTTSSGTTYGLSEDSKLTSKTCYIKIRSDTGRFFLNVYSPELQTGGTTLGPLLDSGVKMTLTNEDGFYSEAILTSVPNTDNKTYDDDFQTENASHVKVNSIFLPSTASAENLYKLEVFAASDIISPEGLMELSGVSFVFTVSPATNYYNVEFWDGGEKPVDVKVIKENDPIGELPAPDPQNPQTFLGWYSGDLKAEESTIITADIICTAKWQQLGHLVVFHTSDSTTEAYITDDQTIGSVAPEVTETREGYEFYGWGLADGTYVPSSTKGSELTSERTDLYIIWVEVEPDPPEPPGPDPPGPEPPDHTTVITEETVINDDGSITDIETIETKYKSGADDT